MNVSDEFVIEATLDGMRHGLAIATQNGWTVSPRLTTHALLEAAAQAMLDLVALHETDRPALLGKLDDLRLLLSTPGAGTHVTSPDGAVN